MNGLPLFGHIAHHNRPSVDQMLGEIQHRDPHGHLCDEFGCAHRSKCMEQPQDPAAICYASKKEDEHKKYISHLPNKVSYAPLEEEWEPVRGEYEEYLVDTKWIKRHGRDVGKIYYVRSFPNVHKIYATTSLKKRGSRVKTRNFVNEFYSRDDAQRRLNEWAKKAGMEPLGPKPQRVVTHIWEKK